MERTEKILPGIKSAVNEKMCFEEVYSVVEKMISEQLKRDEKQIEEKAGHFYDCAQSLLLKAVQEMIEMFSLEYDKPPFFKCFLGVYNPFPREVLKKEYFLHYNISDDVFMRASLHEINHMIFFDKWKSMHGYSGAGEPIFPETLWFLEELVIEPTLNDERIQRLVPIKHSAYDSFKKTEIEGMSLTQHIQNIYDGRKNIEDFIDRAYKFIYDKKI